MDTDYDDYNVFPGATPKNATTTETPGSTSPLPRWLYIHLERNKKPSILSKEATSPCQGHLNCVTFLINFGVNIWDLDIDLHSAKVLGLGKRMKEIEILWSSKKWWRSWRDHHHDYRHYRHHRRHCQDLAAINSREDILKYLDAAGAQQEAANSKQAKSLQVREKSPRNVHILCL